MVCSVADTFDTTVLNAVSRLRPDFVIVPWGVTAGKPSDCGASGFNATGYAAEAAKKIGSAVVVGANAVGSRTYGRFLPSVYCGHSGWATLSGEVGGETLNTKEGVVYFDLPTPSEAR